LHTLAVHKVFQTFFEDHISYYTAALGPDILHNVIACFGVCYIPPNQQILRKYCILYFH